jgi:hypothetical protein
MLVQDIQLAFVPPYPIELVKGSGQSSTSTPYSSRPNQFPPDGTTYQSNPSFNNPPQNMTPGNCPPGIPCDKLRPYQPQPQTKKDDDVDDDDGDN